MRLLTFLAFLVLVPVGQVAHAKYIPSPDFRGIPWGANIETLKDTMTQSDEDGDTKCYHNKDEKLKIGDADLTDIGYCFYQGHLFFVILKFSDLKNYSIIKDTLFQKYGPGDQSNEYIENYWWGLDSDVALTLDYSDISTEGTVAYRYKPLADKKDRDQTERNKNSKDDI